MPSRIHTLVVELIDVCNLNCAYCLRDEGALHGRPHALPVALLERTLRDLRSRTDRCNVVFTGGEPTLHPDFRGILRTVRDAGFRYSVITNGWTFSRSLPVFLEFRESLAAIAFSIDGATQADHDALRGRGSFERVMSAVAACREHDLRFRYKVTVDRNKAVRLAAFAALAKETGADRLELGPLFPTSSAAFDDVLSVVEQEAFLREVAFLRESDGVQISLAAGFIDRRPEPVCGPLLGEAINLDYRGRLALCTVLTGFRGQTGDRDIVADLHQTPLADGLVGIERLVDGRNQERLQAFSTADASPATVSLRLASPCLDCLCAFGKIDVAGFARVDRHAAIEDSDHFTISTAAVASGARGEGRSVRETRTGRVVDLNSTAGLLWNEIQSGRSVAEMVDALTRTFEVDEAQARRSVHGALIRLQSLALIRRDDGRERSLNVPDPTQKVNS